MSDVVAMVGGDGVSDLPERLLDDVEEWAEGAHYKSHDVSLICAGAGPWWVLCQDCEWSEVLPDDVLEEWGIRP